MTDSVYENFSHEPLRCVVARQIYDGETKKALGRFYIIPGWIVNCMCIESSSIQGAGSTVVNITFETNQETIYSTL